MQVTVKEDKGAQQHEQADEAVEKGCAHGNDRQDLNREHDLFDVIDIGENQSGRAVKYLAEQVQHD